VLGYALNDPSTAVDQARKRALDDAKAKAENYASSLGFSLGKAMEIEEPSYPDIEIGPTYGWGMPWRMNDRFWGFSRINRLFRDDYIPEGMAKVTAYVSVTYKAVSASG
ncbi:MAG: SIMPL domain-containing protein, partial [Methanothrix sp.]|nr:SIMPL domain-containing protein [Methanothrix sp.]